MKNRQASMLGDYGHDVKGAKDSEGLEEVGSDPSPEVSEEMEGLCKNRKLWV